MALLESSIKCDELLTLKCIDFQRCLIGRKSDEKTSIWTELSKKARRFFHIYQCIVWYNSAIELAGYMMMDIGLRRNCFSVSKMMKYREMLNFLHFKSKFHHVSMPIRLVNLLTMMGFAGSSAPTKIKNNYGMINQQHSVFNANNLLKALDIKPPLIFCRLPVFTGYQFYFHSNQ